ncbi:unnamed protein product [Orchesella dallaii]|uniref:Ricin B lectin domain-containing protein n=1 Tax=Orchesella dallaii TaxID=48710 RepID=A0ABP1R7Y7_9HEXA
MAQLSITLAVAVASIGIAWQFATCQAFLLFDSPGKLEPKNTRVLEHQSSGKCLTVSDEFVLFLDDCAWNKGRQEVASVFSVIKSNSGGHLLRWASGPKPEGIQGCLADRVESEYGEVLSQRPQLVGCDARAKTQSWRFDKVADAQYLIRGVGEEGQCLSMSGHDNEDYPRTIKCNTQDPEQLWRICENLSNLHKCDL